MTSLKNTAGKTITLLLCTQLVLSPTFIFAVDATSDTAEQSQVDETPDLADEASDDGLDDAQPRRINTIIISGNKHVPAEAILDRLPFREGEIFEPYKTRTLIQNLYYDLKRFRNISVRGQNIGTDLIDIYIVVDEKKVLKDIVIEGNKQVTRKDMDDKLHFSELPAIDEEELKKYAIGIQKIYMDKGFHQTEITPTLRLEDEDKATAVFTIKEHPQSLVKRILFKGNNNVSAKQLRSVIFSREDWIGSFMDKAGTYQPERLNGDKHMLEQYYQNNGFLNAKVVDTEIVQSPQTRNITIIYEIREGDCYTIKDVKTEGKDILKEEFVNSILPIKPGDLYSREKIIDAIKTLEFLWGDFGYIYAHIDPVIQSDDDNKTVSIDFQVDLGDQVYLNKINIRGNKKTRDKIIRRKISLEEGALITNTHMEGSKNRIEGLGYFDQRDGVNWKTTRLSATTADLDLILKEIKTGDAHLKVGFGGSAQNIQSQSSSVSLEGNISDTNLGGSGVRMNLAVKLATDEKTLLFNITEPWLFDRPIYGSLDLYHKRFGYDQFSFTPPINEKDTGGALTTGFITGTSSPLFNDIFVRFGLGIDNVDYGRVTIDGRSCPKIPRGKIPALCNDPDNIIRTNATAAYDFILAREFDPGTFVSLTAQFGQDRKNHPMHPSRGIAWIARQFFAMNALDSCIGFSKTDFDLNWYTPLIGDYNLIFRLHTYAGFIVPFKNKTVPYRELFHIGGPASVRGFLFGQIGPQFTVTDSDERLRQDSIGGDKTFFVNTELIFPILNDFTMKGVVFYDGGAGWNNPYVTDLSQPFVRNNFFNYRHAVGVGLRILNPVPIRLDWGFKLDPRRGEAAYEVHFGMTYDW